MSSEINVRLSWTDMIKSSFRPSYGGTLTGWTKSKNTGPARNLYQSYIGENVCNCSFESPIGINIFGPIEIVLKNFAWRYRDTFLLFLNACLTASLRCSCLKEWNSKRYEVSPSKLRPMNFDVTNCIRLGTDRLNWL